MQNTNIETWRGNLPKGGMGFVLKRASVLKLWELQDKDNISQGGHGGGKIKKPSILTFAAFSAFLEFRMITITTVMATTTTMTMITMMTKMLTITTLLESKAGWEDLASH